MQYGATYKDPLQEKEEELSRKAEAISEHIVNSRNQSFIKTEVPIKDLNQEELKTLVEDRFDEYGLNYILVGNYDRNIKDKPINLMLNTSQPVREIAEVQEMLERRLEGYIGSLKRDCESCKAKIYQYLRAYQDEQKRKKEGNPFSN